MQQYISQECCLLLLSRRMDHPPALRMPSLGGEGQPQAITMAACSHFTAMALGRSRGGLVHVGGRPSPLPAPVVATGWAASAAQGHIKRMQRQCRWRHVDSRWGWPCAVAQEGRTWAVRTKQGAVCTSRKQHARTGKPVQQGPHGSPKQEEALRQREIDNQGDEVVIRISMPAAATCALVAMDDAGGLRPPQGNARDAAQRRAQGQGVHELDHARHDMRAFMPLDGQPEGGHCRGGSWRRL